MDRKPTKLLEKQRHAPNSASSSQNADKEDMQEVDLREELKRMKRVEQDLRNELEETVRRVKDLTTELKKVKEKQEKKMKLLMKTIKHLTQ